MDTVKILLKLVSKTKGFNTPQGIILAVPLRDIEKAIDEVVIERQEELNDTPEGVEVT